MLDQTPFYTLDQVAKRLQVHKRTVMRAIHLGQLSAFKAGRALRIKSEALEAYIAERTVKPGELIEGDEEDEKEPAA